MTLTTSSSGAPVGLLYDSISRNTGDCAIGISLHQTMAALGLESFDEPVRPAGARPAEGLIIGGGELIRPTGDEFYDAFRPRGRHILNGVGVWPSSDDLSYLNEYAYVSVRTRADADVLTRAGVPDIEVIPCLTTMLRSDASSSDEVSRRLPPDDGTPLIGIHIVPHTMTVCPEIADVVNSLEGRKLLIPFTHYNQDRSFMGALGIRDAVLLDEMSPLELHSLIGQLDLLIASSLHASIFAYSQNVPFVSARQPKVLDYFTDRGLEAFVFSDARDLDRALTAASSNLDFSALVAADRAALEPAIERWAEILGDRSPGASRAVVDQQEDPLWVAHLLDEQLLSVVEQRDVLLSAALTRHHILEDRMRFELGQLQAELEAVRYHRAHERAELLEMREAAEQLDALMRTRMMRVLRLPRMAYGRLRRALGLGT